MKIINIMKYGDNSIRLDINNGYSIYINNDTIHLLDKKENLKQRFTLKTFMKFEEIEIE